MLEIQAEAGRERLDRFLVARLPHISLSKVRRMIADGIVLINGEQGLPGQRLSIGDRIAINASSLPLSAATPEELPLDIMFEDEHIIVINKAAGVLVHPSNKVKTGTLTNALSHYYLVSGQKSARTGLVHRLDAHTSGIIVIAKTLRAHRGISKAFHERHVAKSYVTIVRGVVAKDSGIIDAPIGHDPKTWPRWKVMDEGRPSQTKYRVQQRFPSHTLLELEPLTGRTHQIRIHCAFIGHPVVGDPFYGRLIGVSSNEPHLKHHLLHASRLEFLHPVSKQQMSFEAPLPKAMSDLIKELSPAI